MTWPSGIPFEINTPIYMLWLIRSGRVNDFASLAREFGYAPGRGDTALYSLVSVLNSLEQADLVVLKDWDWDDWGFPRGQIKLSPRWPKIQASLDLSLTELSRLGSESIIARPYFGKPKVPAKQHDLFVLMPFTADLQPVYDDHITSCAGELNLSVARGDDFFTAQSIMGDVWNAISTARAVIADCTGRNPNVFYEIGLAHAIGKTVILLTQNSEDVPFDIRHLRYIQYDFTPRGMRIFEKKLADTLRTELRLDQDRSRVERRITFIVADDLNDSAGYMGQEYRAVSAALAPASSVVPWSQIYVPDFGLLLHDEPGMAPQIVHAVGRPDGQDAIMTYREDEPHKTEPSALAAAFEAIAPSLHCVVLSQCFSEDQAEAIASQAPYVVGIHAGIGSAAAMSFAVDFYRSLEAGRTIVEAHEIAANRVRIEGTPEHRLPILMRRG